MKSSTIALWKKQDQHEGDRWRLFRAVSELVPAHTVLYPGSFVDIAPSFVFPSVTYIDSDRRPPGFFSDREGLREIVAAHAGSPPDPEITFIHGDYCDDLGVPEQSFDLLVSLYAGLVSEHCTRYLRVGGALLVNPSHGDAAMASIDPRYRLAAVIHSRSGDYHLSTAQLDTYLKPKRVVEVTAELLHRTGRGVGYTKSPFAYLFERVA